MTRYADGPETTVEVVIRASPDRLWNLVTDPTLPARFSDELQEASWGEHPSGAPGLGSVIEGRNKNDFIGEWTTQSFVTAWEPGVIFSWAVREVDQSAARWAFELEAQGENTLLRQRYQMGPGPSGMSQVIDEQPDKEEQLIEGRLAWQGANMQRNLDAIKALAEA